MLPNLAHKKPHKSSSETEILLKREIHNDQNTFRLIESLERKNSSMNDRQAKIQRSKTTYVWKDNITENDDEENDN